jgi:hypothetical protein
MKAYPPDDRSRGSRSAAGGRFRFGDPAGPEVIRGDGRRPAQRGRGARPLPPPSRGAAPLLPALLVPRPGRDVRLRTCRHAVLRLPLRIRIPAPIRVTPYGPTGMVRRSASASTSARRRRQTRRRFGTGDAAGPGAPSWLIEPFPTSPIFSPAVSIHWNLRFHAAFYSHERNSGEIDEQPQQEHPGDKPPGDACRKRTLRRLVGAFGDLRRAGRGSNAARRLGACQECRHA